MLAVPAIRRRISMDIRSPPAHLTIERPRPVDRAMMPPCPQIDAIDGELNHAVRQIVEPEAVPAGAAYEHFLTVVRVYAAGALLPYGPVNFSRSVA